jgi:hypothetical protein
MGVAHLALSNEDGSKACSGVVERRGISARKAKARSDPNGLVRIEASMINLVAGERGKGA